MTHQLPQLGYDYSALEPYIDARTMEIHHGKHHQAYVNNLNSALEGHADLQKLSIEELISDLSQVPESIRAAVRNHGGGHANHTLFWSLLKKDVPFEGEVASAISDAFGSLDDFKQQFTKAAMGVFGSGWAWLVQNGGKLHIVGTPNQDSPLSQGWTPILGVDVWEHAYYLKYQNKRNEYLDAIFSVVNWEAINRNFVNAREMVAA
jgi:Fe-Mn family superoxide dismutase